MDQIIEIALHLCYPSPKARAVNPDAVKVIAASIEEVGLLTPITVRKCERSRSGQTADAFEVIAGLHRVKAFRSLGRETIPAVVLDVDDLHAELMLIDENLCRNDLSPAERASAQARRKAIYQELHPETKRGAAGGKATKDRTGEAVGQFGQQPRFDEAAAAATGQSERSVRRDVTRGEALGEEVLSRVAHTSLDKGEELDALVKLPPGKREEVIARAQAGEKVSVKTAAKQELRDLKESNLGAHQRALPSRKFGVILADPEWRFKTYSRETGLDRAADNHYPTSELEDIASRDVQSISADDAVLFLWTTAPFLMAAGEIIKAWGFEYKSNFVWAKDRIGTGYWNRNKHEHLLVATRGDKLPAPAPGTQWESLIEAAVGRHSEKPTIFYELIEAYYPNLPKIELNARQARSGWERWGLEAPDCEAQLPQDPDTGAVFEEEDVDQSIASVASASVEDRDGPEAIGLYVGGKFVTTERTPPPAEQYVEQSARAPARSEPMEIPAFLRRQKAPETAD